MLFRAVVWINEIKKVKGKPLWVTQFLFSRTMAFI